MKNQDSTRRYLGRREFLADCGKMTCIGAMASMINLRLLNKVMAARVPGSITDYKGLVCVFLNGGPYVKVENNPVIPGNHEVVVWPQGEGVAAMIGNVGPKELTRSILYSEDGMNFTKTHEVINVPHAAGTYRPEAFSGTGKGEAVEWGVEIGKGEKLPFIRRFDIEWSDH